MKISFIKEGKDHKSFVVPKLLGFDVFSIENVEKIDSKIDELIADKYNTIIITKDLAGFSEKINKEYLKDKSVEIIISRR